MDQELVRINPSGNMPLVNTRVAQDRLAEIRAFAKTELREGIDQDYAVIPGTGKKPSLLQPGAEKLLEKLRLGPRYPQINWTLEDHDRGAYMVDVLCQLIYHGTGQVVAECWGSAARDAQEEVNEANAKKAAYAKKDGKPAPEPRVLTMRDKGLARNTALKMAQKSGLVGATLKAARLAVDFTQDVEDFSGQGQTQTAASTESTAFCSKHPTEAVRHHEKDGKKWWSHKLPDGKYCNAGPAKQQEVPSESAFDAAFETLESEIERSTPHGEPRYDIAVEPEQVKPVATPTITRPELLSKYSDLLKRGLAAGIEVEAVDLRTLTNDQVIARGKDLLYNIELAQKVGTGQAAV